MELGTKMGVNFEGGLVDAEAMTGIETSGFLFFSFFFFFWFRDEIKPIAFTVWKERSKG
jgi:hypothetical protein